MMPSTGTKRKTERKGSDHSNSDESTTKKRKVQARKNTSDEKDGSKASISKESKSSKKNYKSTVECSKKAMAEIDGSNFEITATAPVRGTKGELVFEDWKEFRPNMTPKEVLQAGSFGGTYFRPIKSGITGKSYNGVWKELPKDWLEGLDIKKKVSSSTYVENVNTYKVKCGGSLQTWEESGWMHPQDPYGWFQWYCRFYQGRRTDDDERQIGRWLRCAGVTGRWRNNLISKCVRSGCSFDNYAVSPVVRQTLQHWAYKLTKEHFEVYAKKMKKKGL